MYRGSSHPPKPRDSEDRCQMTDDRGRKAEGTIASFEDLEVFRRAYRLSLSVHKTSLNFPAIRSAGRRSRYAPTWLKDGPSRRNRAPSSSGSFRWLWDPATRCAFGSAIASIWVTWTKRLGRNGETSIRRYRRCCKGFTGPGSSGFFCRLSSVFCLLDR